MQRIADLKIQGVFCTGVMGRIRLLRKEERKRVVEIVVEEAHRRGVKVIAHTAHHSAHETVELTRHAEQVGADFAILMNPYYPPQREQTIYEWFQFVASRVDIGIWMFDAEYSGLPLSGAYRAHRRYRERSAASRYRAARSLRRVQQLLGGKLVMSEPTETLWLKMMREYGQRVFQSSPAPYLFQTPTSTPMHDYTELGLQGKFAEAEKIAAPMQPLREMAAKWTRSKWVNEKLVPIAISKRGAS